MHRLVLVSTAVGLRHTTGRQRTGPFLTDAIAEEGKRWVKRARIEMSMGLKSQRERVEGATSETGGHRDAEDILIRDSGIVLTLGRSAIFYVPAKLLPALGVLAGVALFTQLLSPSEYGSYSIALAGAGIVQAVLFGWLRQATFRFLPEFQNEGRYGEFIRQSTWHVFAIMAVGCLSLAVMLIAWSSSPISRSLQLGTLILFVSSVAFNYLVTIYEATLEPRKAAVYASVRAVGRLGLSLALLLLVARSAVSPVTAGALAYLFVVVHMLRDLSFGSHLRRLGHSFSVHLLRRLVVYGFPLAGWSLMQQVLGAFDRFIIAYYRGSAEVGIYSSNYRLVRGALSLVAAPVLMAAHPLIINVWEETRNRRKVEGLIALASKYYLMIAFPIVAFVAIMSRQVAGAFLGPQYREGAVIIPIVLVGFMTSGLSLYVQKGLEIARCTGRMFKAALACAVVSLVSNLMLVPRYGYRGAAVTTALSYSLYLLLVHVASRGYLAWTVSRRSLVNVLLATLALAGVALALRASSSGMAPLLQLLVTGIPSLAAYLGSLFLLGELRGEVSLAKERILQHLRSR